MCIVCQHSASGKGKMVEFTSSITHKKYPIKQFCTCGTKYIVYLITCPCGKQYVGRTICTFSVRVGEDIALIKSRDTKHTVPYPDTTNYIIMVIPRGHSLWWSSGSSPLGGEVRWPGVSQGWRPSGFTSCSPILRSEWMWNGTSTLLLINRRSNWVSFVLQFFFFIHLFYFIYALLVIVLYCCIILSFCMHTYSIWPHMKVQLTGVITLSLHYNYVYFFTPHICGKI